MNPKTSDTDSDTDSDTKSTKSSLTQDFLVFILIIIAMLIKAFNYLTEWPKFEKSFNRSDSQYIKNSLFEKSILSTVQRSIRRMSNVTLMRPNNVYNVSVHRARMHTAGFMTVANIR